MSLSVASPDLAKCEELDDTYSKAEVLAVTILAEVKTEFSYARTVSEKSCHFSHLSDSIIFVKAKDLVASVLGKATEDIAKAAMEMSYVQTVSEIWSLTLTMQPPFFSRPGTSWQECWKRSQRNSRNKR